MNILTGPTVDLYVVLKNGTPDQILQMLGNETIDLTGRYDVVGDTVYHAILRNKHLTEQEIIAISRIFLDRRVNPAFLNRHAKAPLYLSIENRARHVAEFFITYNPRIPGNVYAATRFFVEDEDKQFWRLAGDNYAAIGTWNSEEVETRSANFLKWLIANEQHGNGEDEDFELTLLLRLAVNCNLQHLLPVLLEHAGERNVANAEHQSLLQLYLKKHALVKKVQSKCRSGDWYSKYSSRYIVSIVDALLDNEGMIVDLPSVRLAVEVIRNIDTVKRMIDRLPSDENLLHLLADGTPTEHDVAVFDLLLSKGYDVNAKDSSGRTPLHLAAKNNNVALAKRLIENKAEIGCQDNYNCTPLRYGSGPTTMLETPKARIRRKVVKLRYGSGKFAVRLPHESKCSRSKLKRFIILRRSIRQRIEKMKSTMGNVGSKILSKQHEIDKLQLDRVIASLTRNC